MNPLAFWLTALHCTHAGIVAYEAANPATWYTQQELEIRRTQMAYLAGIADICNGYDGDDNGGFNADMEDRE